MKKILLSSDCNGNFEKLFQKVNQLQLKNKFDVLFLVGKVCPPSSSQIIQKIISGEIKVPISTYFIDCSSMSTVLNQVYPQGKQLAHNFTFLGKMGTKLISGLKVGYVSGEDCHSKIVAEKLIQTEEFIPKLSYKGNSYCLEDCHKMIETQTNKSQSLDILLTNQWPEQLPQILNISEPIIQTSELISKICYQLNPKYHIISGGSKYLRHNTCNQGNTISFINVCGLPQRCTQMPKDKYLVAIQVDTLSVSQMPINTNIEQFPFNQRNKFCRQKKYQQQNQVLLQEEQANIEISNQDKIRKIMQANKNNKKTNKGKTQEGINQTSLICFEGFPSGTSDLEITQFLQRWGDIKQISISPNSGYKSQGSQRSGIVRFKDIQTAQICLKDSNRYTLYQSRIKFHLKQQHEKYRVNDCFLCIGKPNFDDKLIVYIGKLCYICIDKGPIERHHYQIVPINHVSNLRELQPQERKQINDLCNMLVNQLKKKNLNTIIYERYVNLSYEINHCMIHCVPVDMQENMIVERFNTVNQRNHYQFINKNASQNSQQKSQSSEQFYISISINSHLNYIKILTNKNSKSIQLSRQIICQIVNKPEKINWRDCIIKQHEIKDSLRFLRSIINGNIQEKQEWIE